MIMMYQYATLGSWNIGMVGTICGHYMEVCISSVVSGGQIGESVICQLSPTIAQYVEQYLDGQISFRDILEQQPV
jgi:hypothetical protein